MEECHRWRSYLHETSAAYRALQSERTAGWQSAALDLWYTRRQTNDTQPIHSAPTSDSAKPVAVSTSFAGADIGKLCARYAAHAERVLPVAAPNVFSPHSTHSSASRVMEDVVGGEATSEGSLRGSHASNSHGMNEPRTFLDLGCAPGGVSRFLVTQLHWSGVGVSLPVRRGGIAMDLSWVPSLDSSLHPSASSSAPLYTFLEGGIATEGSETTEPTRSPHTHEKETEEGEEEEDVNWCAKIAGKHFYFVNGGAVQDHGQRGKEWPDAPTRDTLAVLPWFTLLLPQLHLALEHVEDGGAVMLVIGVPQCASLAILVEMLHPMVRGGVRVMETMHLSKGPVYLLLTGVYARTEREVWTHAMAKMRSGERNFWLGETDEGFALAKSGWERCREDLEAVWVKMGIFLRQRRVLAEQEMKLSSGKGGKRRRHEV